MMSELCESVRRYIKNLPDLKHPWELLEFLNQQPLNTDLISRKVDGLEGAEVYCGSGVVIQPYTLFTGKVFLGNNVRIGPFSFIRGTVVIGDNSMIGPHTEIMRVVIGDNSVLAHRNLIGDTIIRDNVKIAGLSTVCNYSSFREKIKIHLADQDPHFYKGKFGTFIGSNVEMGALTIVMPGAYIRDGTKIIGQSVVYGDTKVKSMVI